MAGLSPYRSQARTKDPARDFGKQLEGSIANGQLVEVDLSGVTNAAIQHSLGRPFRGAFVVGITSSASYYVLPPDSGVNDTPETAVLLIFSASFTGTVRLWVF